MLYIKNNRQYACTFNVTKDGKAKTFTFDCKRIYTDTGNVATTGFTPIEDSDYEWLYTNCKQFKLLVDKGDFVRTKESGAAEVANKIDTLAKENEILKAKLEEKTKEAATASSKELEDAKKENETLKAQLEALKKTTKKSVKKTETETKLDESEGF